VFAQPKDVVIADGTEEEYQRLCEEMCKTGQFTRLNDKLRPNSFLARSGERPPSQGVHCSCK
jgi:phosphoenolpyruvate carboxykinase (GTP)